LIDLGIAVDGEFAVDQVSALRGRFLSLKPGLFAAGEGEARFRDFRYRVPA
jgi:hypothetical protein